MKLPSIKTNKPAFPGARFDVDGYCVAHPTTRLCMLTDDGKYKIVRKTCNKCGSAALSTKLERGQTNVHGYKKKPSKHREVQGMMTASGQTNHHLVFVNGQSHLAKPIHKPHSESKHKHRDVRHGDLNRSFKADKESDEPVQRGRALGEGHEGRRIHRSRTFSPSRSSFRRRTHHANDLSQDDAPLEVPADKHPESDNSRSLSPVRKPSLRGRTTTTRSSLRASKQNHVPVDVPKEKHHLKEDSRSLSPIRKPDLSGSRGRTLSPVRRKKPANGARSSSFKQVFTKMRSLKNIDDGTKRYDALPFDHNGCCHYHPDVQLAKKNAKGTFDILQDLCSLCNAESNPPVHNKPVSKKHHKADKADVATRQLKHTKKKHEGKNSDQADPNEMAIVPLDPVILSPKKPTVKDISNGHIVSNEMALVPFQSEGTSGRVEYTKSPKINKETCSDNSPTSIMSSPNGGKPSQALSSKNFPGANKFPVLPLTSEEFNSSYADTIKHTNASVPLAKERMVPIAKERQPRTATLSRF